MCMNRMKSILLHIIFVKFKLANQNLDDNLYHFLVCTGFYRGFYRPRKKSANHGSCGSGSRGGPGRGGSDGRW